MNELTEEIRLAEPGEGKSALAEDAQAVDIDIDPADKAAQDVEMLIGAIRAEGERGTTVLFYANGGATLRTSLNPQQVVELFAGLINDIMSRQQPDAWQG